MRGFLEAFWKPFLTAGVIKLLIDPKNKAKKENPVRRI
jgi:hypothetical protein